MLFRSFTVPEECITGFIGVNGAGKSTTIHSILNLVQKDAGTIQFRGKDISKNEKAFKDKIGVVFDSGCFYEELSQGNRIVVRNPLYEK